MRDHTRTMLRSAAREAIVFSIFIFGISVIIPELVDDEPARFSWPRLAGGIGLGMVLWFGMALLFYRPASWQIPAADQDWLDQQIGYLRLQPAKKRQLAAGGQAYHAPQAFHSAAELWVRPVAGQLRVDGPRNLIRRLQKRYAKRSGDKA
jgi:hypothetical protein